MPNPQTRTVAVSNPGGRARHYRVQVRSNDRDIWRHSAVFGNRQSANQCVEELQKTGLQIRIVHFRLPTAA